MYNIILINIRLARICDVNIVILPLVHSYENHWLKATVWRPCIFQKVLEGSTYFDT